MQPMHTEMLNHFASEYIRKGTGEKIYEFKILYQQMSLTCIYN